MAKNAHSENSMEPKTPEIHVDESYADGAVAFIQVLLDRLLLADVDKVEIIRLLLDRSGFDDGTINALVRYVIENHKIF
jgi:hypothetical protein